MTRPEDCELVDRAGEAMRDDCLEDVHLDVRIGVVGVLTAGVTEVLFSVQVVLLLVIVC